MWIYQRQKIGTVNGTKVYKSTKKAGKTCCIMRKDLVYYEGEDDDFHQQQPLWAWSVRSILQERRKRASRQAGLLSLVMDVYRGDHERDGSERNNTGVRQRYERGLGIVQQRIELVSDLLLYCLRNIYCTITDAANKTSPISLASIC